MSLAVLGAALTGVLLPGALSIALLARGLGGLAVPVGWTMGLVLHYQAVIWTRAAGVSPQVAEAGMLVALALLVAALAFPSRREISAVQARASAGFVKPPWLLVAVALASNLYLAALLASHIPGVFEAWDAVVSWHRWAADWAAGRWPSYTYGYPQLVPVTWSGFYVWMGTDRAEFAARALMAAFPLLVTAVLVDAGLRSGRAAPWLAAALWPLVLQAFFADVIDSGYVDVPVTFFLLLTASLLAWVALGQLPAESGLVAAAVAAAAAVLTKQAGWFVLAFAAMFVGFARHQALWRRSLALRAALIGLVLALPSIAASWWVLASGREPGNFTYVTSTIYGGENLPARLVRATVVTLGSRVEAWMPLGLVAAVVALLAALACRERPGRWLWLGVVLPYYLCWALFFSYDLRNLLPAIPFLCLGLGIGFETLGRWGLRRLVRVVPRVAWVLTPAAMVAGRVHTPSRRWGRLLAVAGVVVAMGLALVPGDRAAWLRAAHTQRMQAGDVELNARLAAHLARHPPTGKILTTYALAAHTDGVREHVFMAPESPSPSAALVAAMRSGEGLCRLISLTPRSAEISHLLLARGFLAPTVDQALAQGMAVEELASDQHRLLRLACPL